MVSFRSVFDDTYGRAWDELTGGGGGDRNAPRHPNYQGPGAGYGEPRDEGFTWFPNAGERLLRDHPLDSRGLPTGYRGLLPHTIAPQVQAAHDQAIWEENRRIMQDAVRGSRAAAGLLQSFRPGGGAAIESGIFSQVAGLQMQRASMNKPLDVLGDFRREEDSRNRRRTNRANERSLAIQGVAALGGIAATIATGGAAAPLVGAGISALGNAYGAYQARKTAESARAGYDEGAPGVRGPAAPGEQAPQGQFPAYTPGGHGAPPPTYSSSGIDPATGGARGTGLTPPQYGPSPGPGTSAQVGLAPDGPGGPQGQQGGLGGQDSPGGAMGAGGGAVGSDGVFAPVAYAADSVRQPAMQNPIVRLVMADTMVNMVEESGIIPAFTFAADRALAKRLAG